MPLNITQQADVLELRAQHGATTEEDVASLTAEETDIQQRVLPPVDSGRRAWTFLFGCFLVELLVWSFPFSFGVLQEYYTTHLSSPSSVSAVGTTCSGILYLLAPPVFVLYNFFPHLRRWSMFYALPVVVLALLLSSFANNVTHLILTQGVVYAIGGCFLYYPLFLYIDEWFVRRKAFAYGVLWAGSSAGGLIGPFVLQWGLNNYGAAGLLRGYAVALLLIVTPLLFTVRPRLPKSSNHNNNWRLVLRSTVLGFGFLRTKEFWILQTANMIQGLGYFVPLLYLPTYASTHDLPPFISSLLPALVSISATPGLLFLTTLSDHRVSIHTIILISALGATLAVFLLWGLASSSMPMLVAFCICYGFFAGGFTAAYAGITMEIRNLMVRRQEIDGKGNGLAGADLGSLLGLLGAGRGIGNIVCGPVSEQLLKGRISGYGSGYGPLIVFTGVTMAVTMSGSIARFLRSAPQARLASLG